MYHEILILKMYSWIIVPKYMFGMFLNMHFRTYFWNTYTIMDQLMCNIHIFFVIYQTYIPKQIFQNTCVLQINDSKETTNMNGCQKKKHCLQSFTFHYNVVALMVAVAVLSLAIWDAYNRWTTDGKGATNYYYKWGLIVPGKGGVTGCCKERKWGARVGKPRGVHDKTNKRAY